MTSGWTWLVAAVLMLLAAVVVWVWTPDRSRAELEARYLEAPADMVEVMGLPLHVRDRGPRDASAVILLHGLGSSLQTWEPWAHGLATEHRVILLDLPGAGLSPPDPTGDYTDSRSLQLIIALMDQLDVARASVVGHSMGGRLAWRLAASHPERVDRLVLVAPDGFASPGFEYGRAPDVPAMLGLMEYALPRPLLRMNLAPAYADPATLTDALTTRYQDLMLAPGARGAMLARMRQTVLQDPVPLLARIQAPTLLVWGEQDAMIPIANADDYIRAMPRATLVSLPGVGHLPHEEAPDRSLEPVLAFLRPGS
jgi:pimeloyl-ACP methyl ester carboxylesterase